MSDSASSILSTCLTDPSTPSGRLQLSPIRPVPPANGSPAPSYMMGCIPRGNPAGRRDYDPATRPTQPSYRLPPHPFTPAPSPPSPSNVGMGTVRRLWIPRRVPLYTRTFPWKHLLQIPTERIWPPQIKSPPAGRQHSDFSLVTCPKTKRRRPLFLACFWLTDHWLQGRRCRINIGGERVAGASTTDTGTGEAFSYCPCSTVLSYVERPRPLG